MALATSSERGPADVLACHHRGVHRLERADPRSSAGPGRQARRRRPSASRARSRRGRGTSRSRPGSAARGPARHPVRPGAPPPCRAVIFRGGRIAGDQVRVRGREQALGAPCLAQWSARRPGTGTAPARSTRHGPWPARLRLPVRPRPRSSVPAAASARCQADRSASPAESHAAASAAWTWRRCPGSASAYTADRISGCRKAGRGSLAHDAAFRRGVSPHERSARGSPRPARSTARRRRGPPRSAAARSWCPRGKALIGRTEVGVQQAADRQPGGQRRDAGQLLGTELDGELDQGERIAAGPGDEPVSHRRVKVLRRRPRASSALRVQRLQCRRGGASTGRRRHRLAALPPARAVKMKASESACSRRAVNASASADSRSSQCTSSTRHSTGCSAAMPDSKVSVARPTR